MSLWATKDWVFEEAWAQLKLTKNQKWSQVRSLPRNYDKPFFQNDAQPIGYINIGQFQIFMFKLKNSKY